MTFEHIQYKHGFIATTGTKAMVNFQGKNTRYIITQND